MAMALPPVAFNFQELVATFSEVCLDFNDDNPYGKTESFGFATKVLYELGPQLHKLKKSRENATWCIELKSSCKVFVYTQSFSRPMNVQPKVRDNKLYLTIKQAGLLATAKLCRMLPPELKVTDRLLLTPMARAIFTPQSLPKIVLDLRRFNGRSVNIVEVLRAVNSSCQVDGFHLADSVCHIAVVAVNACVSDAMQRFKISEKTKRSYKKHGKDFDANLFEIYARHAKLSSRDVVELDQEVKEIKSDTPSSSKADEGSKKTLEVLRSASDANSNVAANVATKDSVLAKIIDKIFKFPDDPTRIELQPITLNDFSKQMTINQKSVVEKVDLEMALTHGQQPIKSLKIQNTDYSGLKTSLFSKVADRNKTGNPSVAHKEIDQRQRAENITPASKNIQTNNMKIEDQPFDWPTSLDHDFFCFEDEFIDYKETALTFDEYLDLDQDPLWLEGPEICEDIVPNYI